MNDRMADGTWTCPYCKKTVEFRPLAMEPHQFNPRTGAMLPRCMDKPTASDAGKRPRACEHGVWRWERCEACAADAGAKPCLCGDTQSGCPAHPRVDEGVQHG